MSLDRFAELGESDPARAWPIFQALWTELTVSNATPGVVNFYGKRPPLMLCIDNLAYLLKNSKYKTVDEKGKVVPIHALDFVQIKHFTDLLSGAATLPNGGIVLAATSASDAPRSDAMNVGIAMAEARQASASSITTTETSSELSPQSQSLKLEDFWNPFRPLDMRSLAALDGVEVTRLKGISKEDAMALMEYWALSGMVRSRVDKESVDFQWTIAGGGVLGELERSVVRYLGGGTKKAARDEAALSDERHTIPTFTFQ